MYAGMSPVSCVASSADGKRVASGCLFGTVCVWDVETRVNVCNVWSARRGTERIEFIAWSADGNVLATEACRNGSARVRIWDVNTGDCLKTVEGRRFGEWSRLYCHLGDKEGYEEEGKKVICCNDEVRYGFGDDEAILATLKGSVQWDYSEASRKLVAGTRTVNFLDLVF